MAREASKLTQAIRQLCDETNFEITYATGRPRLAKMGLELAAAPNENMNDDVAAFEAAYAEMCNTHDFNPESETDLKDLRDRAVAKLGWTAHKGRTVLKEVEARRLFKNERNGFDVVKSNWKNSLHRTAASAKPVADATPKGRTAKAVGKRVAPNTTLAVKPKHGRNAVPASTATEELAALTKIEANGGLTTAAARMAELTNAVAKLKADLAAAEDEKQKLAADLELIDRLKKRLKAA